MSNRVLTWKMAIESGCNPSEYSYDADDVPLGEFEATLEFKIWAKNTMGISCYFIEKHTGKKFRLTVFRQTANKAYTLDSGGISFVESPVNCTYLLKVSRNAKGRIIFEKAEVVQ